MSEEAIRKWVQETAANLCRSCEDSCCNGIKHRICLEEEEQSALELFVEKGIPVYRMEELDEESVKRWIDGGHQKGEKVYTKNGKEIQKPSLVEHHKLCTMEGIIIWLESKEFTMYVDKYCPFYNPNRGCEVHEDSRRPEVCIKYPVFEISSNDFSFTRSCKSFNKREVREDFRRKFPEPKYTLLVVVEKENENSVNYICYSGGKTLNEVEYGTKVIY